MRSLKKQVRQLPHIVYKSLTPLALCVMLATSGNNTYAYLTADYPVTATFCFNMDRLEITIEENETGITVVNSGNKICFVRAAVDYADEEIEEQASVVLQQGSGWTDMYITADGPLGGYFYYTEPVPGDSGTGILFTSAGEAADIYAECIPADGISEYENAWRNYFE